MNDQIADKVHLLLVEDDKESGMAMNGMLTKRHMEVQMAENVEDAIKLFTANTYDIVVTDIRLGKLSGIDLLRYIRRNNLNFPVILLTGYEDLDSAINAVKLGASDYILKPLDDIDKLVRPITKAVKHHKTEEQLIQYRQKLQALTLELILAEEKERHRMAVDLHDSISQAIGSLKIRLDLLAENRKHKEFCDEINNISATAGTILKEIRTLTFQLCPTTLYELGLNQALADLVETTRATYKTDIILKTNRAPKPLNKDLEILLFRSARELIMNVVKHAKARRTEVSINENDNQIELVIEDNGKGFDVAMKMNKGLGLFSIAERVQYIGGRCIITSESGKGTCARITTPANTDMLIRQSLSPSGLRI